MVLVRKTRLSSSHRCFCSVRRRWYHELSFKKTGPSPVEVLTYNSSVSSDDDGVVAPPPPPSTAGGSGGGIWGSSSAVRIEMHAAPWNPADVNTVQGRYPSPYPNREDSDLIKSRYQQSRYFPGFTIAGSEGIGRVVSAPTTTTKSTTTGNSDVEDLKVGDWVTFGLSGFGTMRSSLWAPRSAVLKLDRGDELMTAMMGHGGGSTAAAAAKAASLFQLGGTAMRLLQDFLPPTMLQQQQEHQSQPFVILQNAGNSGVGFMISNLARILYPHAYVVSLVRRGPHRSEQDMERLVAFLQTDGGNSLVIAEEDVLDNSDALRNLKRQIREISAEQPPVAIALNSVGGPSSDLLLKLLDKSGNHVTYGGMSKQPVSVSTSQLIFRDVTLRGYWHSRWMVESSLQEKTRMVNDLVDMVLLEDADTSSNNDICKALKCPPVEVFPLSQFNQALAHDNHQSKQAIRSKVVFDCRE